MKYSLDTKLSKTTQEEQRLCSHFTQIVTEESPEKSLSQFELFWIDGGDYPDEQIATDRDNLLSYKMDQEAFNVCLYKCCQILIDEWQKKPETDKLIIKLVDLLMGPPANDANAYWRSRTALRLNERMQGFRKSEQAESLQHFLGLLQPSQVTVSQLKDIKLKSLLYRYPYLYPYSLIGEDNSQLSQSVRRIKLHKTKEFDTNLSQYVIDQVRRPRSEEVNETPQKKAGKFFSKNNPTFLSDKELNRAFQEYLGKLDGTPSNRDLAQNFSLYQSEIHFYGDFKKILYQYLTKKLTSNYCNRQFNPLLEKNLANILPQKTDDPLTDFLVMRTCTETLHFLVVENAPPNKHVTFMNLIANLGAMRTTSLLMRIMLICPQVRSQLEKQLWILFKNYQHSPCSSVKGLIKIWENYNVAMACYFGKADLSWCLQIPRTK